MTCVWEVLRGKPPEVWTVGPEVTVFEALAVMAEKNVGALPVVKNGRLIGMFSERDYARKVALEGKSSRELTVGEIMSQPVVTVKLNETIDTCMKLMTDRRVRHLPVLDGHSMVGLISIGDVVKSIIADQQFLIQNLEAYIGNSR